MGNSIKIFPLIGDVPITGVLLKFERKSRRRVFGSTVNQPKIGPIGVLLRFE